MEVSPRGEAPRTLSRFSPHVFGDWGSGKRAPASVPIGSPPIDGNARAVLARGRWGNREEELRSREGRAKGCMGRLRPMDTDEDERPALSRWETSVRAEMLSSISRVCGPASTRQELFCPCSSLGKVRKRNEFIGITRARGRPRRTAVLGHGGLSPSLDRFAGSNGRRASDRRRHRDVLGRPPGREPEDSILWRR